MLTAIRLDTGTTASNLVTHDKEMYMVQKVSRMCELNTCANSALNVDHG